MMRSYLLVLLGSVLFLAACAGPREAAEEPREPADELPTPAADLAQYEDFDPGPYPDAPPAPPVVEHDVPDELMDGRVTDGPVEAVQGFRVQVYSTVERAEALRMEEELRAWWQAEQELAPGGLFGEMLPVHTRYLQPYYRVRIGDFATREAAERARAYLAQRYPDAFIVPDTVTIRR